MFRFNKQFSKRNNYLLLGAAWLLTLAFVINNYWSVTSTPRAVQKTIEKKITERQLELKNFLEDTAALATIINRKVSAQQLSELRKKSFYLFMYEKNGEGVFEEKFWTTQISEPDSLQVQQTPKEGFIRLPNGWFLTQSKSLQANGKDYKFIGLIPVKWEYYIENQYLQNDFVDLPDLGRSYKISITGNGLPIQGINGKVFFYLEKTADTASPRSNRIALFFGILALVFILFYVHRLANTIARMYGFIKGLSVLLASIILIRIISYQLNPYNFRQLQLFSEAEGQSLCFIGSLGDLFITSLIFVWVIFFVRFNIKGNNLKLRERPLYARYIAGFAIGLIISAVTFCIGRVIASLIADHNISFDVINFFSLDLYSFIGFIVLTSLATGYFFFVQLIIIPLKDWIPEHKIVRLMLIAAAGLLMLSFDRSPYISFKISLLIWLIIFVTLLEFRILLLHAYRLISSRFIFWAFFFSVSIAAIVIVQNRAKELDARKKFAENLSNKVDPSAPVIMNIILTDFRNEYLSRVFYRFKDPMQGLLLKDSLLNESFSGYLNKYHTEIYTYDTSGAPLSNLRPATFNDLNAIIQSQGKPTGVPDLYYYDVSYSNFNYITRKTIFDTTGAKEGYIFIISKPRKFESETVYPELFSRGNKNSIESSSEYAFAIYNKGTLTSSYNDYPFSTEISENTFLHSGFKTIHRNGFEELWYQPQPGTIIVITRKDRFFLESVTLFAYLFISFLLITLIFNVIGYLMTERKDRNKTITFWRFTIRNQVHGTIILISVFSFVVIGISTILFFINRYHDANREFLSRTIHVMENELHNTLDSVTSHSISTRSLDRVSKNKLDRIINNVSNIHAIDINLYNLNGKLEVSSLPLPYEKGILSSQMDPVAWHHLHRLKEAQHFQQQQIGSLKYLSNYIPVRDETGKQYAYLNIPYFESQKKLQDEISNFLVAIINLNAFIFLIAGIIALFITNKITRSFSIISNKMKQIKLQTGNEEIFWPRNDEIGELVDEYNKMVRQLEISADKLARSEREGAWQEMARQVAHEIKNPLTPMKLNLQYLQMAIERNDDNVKNISLYVANIILEQIEHLSKIASDFAQFANIGNIHLQTLDLNEILENVVSLYATNEKVDIKFSKTEHLLIEADKTQMNRLFTNLLQNAVQSVPEFKNIKIEINSAAENGYAMVSVKDNGIGIPISMQSKIFTPNFTTKTSGTGLGLAMSRGIVEKIGGTISFDTKEGEWTVFYVRIPLKAEASDDLND